MSFGHDRERQVKKVLEEEGWHVIRAAGSLGTYDLVAMKDGHRPRLIEVKGNRDGGPFANFRPPERYALSRAAYAAGGDAELAYWPKGGKLKWYEEDDWPENRKAAA